MAWCDFGVAGGKKWGIFPVRASLVAGSRPIIAVKTVTVCRITGGQTGDAIVTIYISRVYGGRGGVEKVFIFFVDFG